MDKLIIALCLFVGVQSFMDELHHLVKRQSDMINFSPQCSATFGTINEKCMSNILSLIDTYKNVEPAAASEWASQCKDNIYDCVASPDTETKEVVKYFQILLPKIKALCADGCMIPIIDLIHDCLSEDALANLGHSRSELEDIFDLVCIQQESSGPEDGEYCMIKAMTTALYLYESNKINYCNLDSINLDTCTNCVCPANCTNLMNQASAMMGCCMGTVLELEQRFNLSHPDRDDLLNPGNQLFTLCGIETDEPCKTSKEIIADQEAIYSSCFSALKSNAKSECVKLEDDVHTAYIAEMQNINKTCEAKKNIGLCQNPTVKISITDDLRSVLTRLNDHCDECGAELTGIRENCTVFLPHEAKMAFQMMCLHNSDFQQCGPRIIEYEAERERVDLNSNPCFKGFMPKVQNTCSDECQIEVDVMNKYNVLNCFDALLEFAHDPIDEWMLWHKNCILTPGVEIKNKINVTVTQKEQSAASSSTNEGARSGTIVKTVAYTFLGTVLISLLITGIVVLIYKRQSIYGMFGYNRFTGDQLITDVHMEDTMGADDGENVYNDYYD